MRIWTLRPHVAVTQRLMEPSSYRWTPGQVPWLVGWQEVCRFLAQPLWPFWFCWGVSIVKAAEKLQGDRQFCYLWFALTGVLCDLTNVTKIWEASQTLVFGSVLWSPIPQIDMPALILLDLSRSNFLYDASWGSQSELRSNMIGSWNMVQIRYFQFFFVPHRYHNSHRQSRTRKLLVSTQTFNLVFRHSHNQVWNLKFIILYNQDWSTTVLNILGNWPTLQLLHEAFANVPRIIMLNCQILQDFWCILSLSLSLCPLLDWLSM